MPGAGATQSAWMDGVPLIPGDGPLQGDAQADVCIVGAGVAGLSTAYLLVRAGRSVIVLDDGPPGMGETLRTTAHLTAAIDDRIFHLERRFGGRKARLVVESTLAAIDRIERICQDERLDGAFRRVDGHLFLGTGDGRETLEKELAAAHRCGLPDVRLEESTPLPFAAGPCLVFPRQAELDAGAYMAGLADAIRRMGGRIHASTHALGLDLGEHPTVRTAGGRVECESVVVCTNSPVFGKVAMHTKQEQYRTYVLGFEVPRGSIPRGLYWDTWHEGSYHYLRLADRAEPGCELLLVGGEDHRTGDGDPSEAMRRLAEWCDTNLGLRTPTYRWSGQVIETADTLPFLGRYPGKGKNVYVITGDSGQGFTNHVIGAMLVTDLIQGHRNAWQGLYSPSRQGIAGLVKRARANVEGMAQTVKGKAGFSPSQVADESEIAIGSGAVVERDGRKVACYREPTGELRECAAECTHMGAIVQWNDLEKTWDCPWHGSRFTARGQVVNGPANKPLDPAEAAPGPEPQPAHGRPHRGERRHGARARGRAEPPPARAGRDDRRGGRSGRVGGKTADPTDATRGRRRP